MRFLCALAGVLLVSACGGTGGTPSRPKDRVRTAELAACDAGSSPVVVGLVSAAGLVRFSLCSDYGDMNYVNHILIKVGNREELFLRGDVSRSEGLSEMIFGGAEGLRIEASRDGVNILAEGRADGQVALRLGTEEIAGGLQFGDPTSPCFGSSGGEEYYVKEFAVGSAQFKAHLCAGNAGTSGGFAYELVGLDITDANQKLAQGVNVKLSGADLKSRVTETSNHHNVCDTLVVRLDAVTYGIINVGGVASGHEMCSGIPGAPDLGTSRVARYRAAYGAQVEEGELPFADYYR